MRNRFTINLGFEQKTWVFCLVIGCALSLNGIKMMEVKRMIKKVFLENNGKFLLKTSSVERLLSRKDGWMGARVAAGDGIPYIEFLNSDFVKNAEKRYRIDHCVCFMLQVNFLEDEEVRDIFTDLLQSKYFWEISKNQVVHMFSLSRSIYDSYVKKAKKLEEEKKYTENIHYLPKGAQFQEKGTYNFYAQEIVEGILNLKYSKTVYRD